MNLLKINLLFKTAIFFRCAIATSNTKINIKGSTFEDNHTNGRGGVLSSNAYTTIKNYIFKNNSASWGGAIYTEQTVNLTIINSVFDGNKSEISSNPYASSSKGAITNGNTLTIFNSVIVNNTAQKKGRYKF